MCSCPAGEDNEPQVVAATLQQLKQMRVTQQLLLSTGAGKVVKALTKSPASEVLEAAQLVVKAWKRCILQT